MVIAIAAALLVGLAFVWPWLFSTNRATDPRVAGMLAMAAFGTLGAGVGLLLAEAVRVVQKVERTDGLRPAGPGLDGTLTELAKLTLQAARGLTAARLVLVVSVVLFVAMAYVAGS